MGNEEVGEVGFEADEADNDSDKLEAVVRGERRFARAGEKHKAVQKKRVFIRILIDDDLQPDCTEWWAQRRRRM